MSLFEAIPDRPLVMPTGAHAARSDARKMFGLREKKCAYCKETFYRRAGEREYIRYRSGKELCFCTWTHVCRWEEETPKQEKGKRKSRKKNLEQKQARVEVLMRDMAKIRAMLDSEAGQDMSAQERNKLRSGLRWRAYEIQKLLEESK